MEKIFSIRSYKKNIPNLKKKYILRCKSQKKNQIGRTRNETPQPHNSQNTMKILNVQNKEGFWKLQEKKTKYKGRQAGSSSTADFFSAHFKSQKAFLDALNILKSYRCQLKLLYLTKLSFTSNGKRKNFQSKSRLKKFRTIK